MVQTFIPVQKKEMKQLMYDLVFKTSNNDAFYGHLRRALFSIMMTAAYGKRIESIDHKDMKYSRESDQLLGKLGKAGTLITVKEGRFRARPMESLGQDTYVEYLARRFR